MTKIYKHDFHQLMRKIPSLSPKERQHLDEIFANRLSAGMDSYELKREVTALKNHQKGYGTETYLDDRELEALQQKVLEYLD